MNLTATVVRRCLQTCAVVAGPLLLLVAGPASATAETPDGFVQTNLVSDQPGVAATTDPNLVNAWGLVSSPTSPWWLNDNGTGLSTLYSGAGAIVPLVVSIPAPAGAPASLIPGPSGIVFNGVSTNFIVSNGTTSGSAAFIFSTEDGTISGWSPGVDRTHAIKVVDNNDNNTGAVYKGLAMGTANGATFLFATNFRSGHVDVFDTAFKPVDMGRDAFRDRFIPDDFAPFGIANIGGNLFVTFAKQNATKDADVAGRGNGFVDEFSTSGKLMRRIATRGVLDSPWGLVVAPAGFGKVGGDLLVGNFGNGRVHAFNLGPMGDPFPAHFAGTLENAQEKPLVIDGLWALQFGNGAGAGPTTTLFFTAGPAAQTHGLFGTLLPQS